MRIAIALAALAALGCEVDLGACDVGEARRIVYDEGGSPAYEGQAMIVSSCGFGAFCHSAGIDAADRNGAPLGLDYDLRLIGADGAQASESFDRLEAMWTRAFDHRRMILAVAGSTMPVRGAVGDAVLDAAPEYVRIDPASDQAVEMPAIETDEGREVLRNWLACGLPIVESTEEDEMPIAIGDVVDGYEVEPLDPSWSDIYERLLSARCASAPCHGATEEAELALGDRASALANMIDVRSRGDDCEDGGAAIIVPGDPDASLLVQKLEGHGPDGAQVCGRLMPIGGSRVSEASIAAIREWIANGAPD